MPPPAARQTVPDEGAAGTREPVGAHAAARNSIASFGAESPQTGKIAPGVCPNFKTITFEAFLVKVPRFLSRGKRRVIVLDSAIYHHARPLAPGLRKQRLRTHRVFSAALQSPTPADETPLKTEAPVAWFAATPPVRLATF